MTFDLYGTAAPAKQHVTTLEALAAAEWTGPDVNGVWHLMWDDHTDYGNETGGGVFTCRLYKCGGGWSFEYCHSERAGGGEYHIPSHRSELSPEQAMAECKCALVSHMKRWEHGAVEYAAKLREQEQGDDE